MPFRRNRSMRRGLALRPIVSTKNVVDNSGVVVGNTSQVLQTLISGVDETTRGAGSNEVNRSATVKGIYLSLFFGSSTNVASPAVPLMDWYIIFDKGGRLSVTPSFGANQNQFPTPGATGISINVNSIIHEEKGLVGEQNDGAKMVFQGVVKLPRHMSKFAAQDKLVLVARSNEDTAFCLKCIYKWYS